MAWLQILDADPRGILNLSKQWVGLIDNLDALVDDRPGLQQLADLTDLLAAWCDRTRRPRIDARPLYGVYDEVNSVLDDDEDESTQKDAWAHLVAKCRAARDMRRKINAVIRTRQIHDQVRLNRTECNAFDYIEQNPGRKGSAIARMVGVMPEYFRARIVPKLEAHGVTSNHDTYFPPNEM